MGKFTQAVESHHIRKQAQPGAPPGPASGAGPDKNSLALIPSIRYNAAHLRLSEQRAVKDYLRHSERREESLL